MTVTLTPADRLRWAGRRAAADRLIKHYPTILIECDLVIVVDDYLAAVESSNAFLREQAKQSTEDGS